MKAKKIFPFLFLLLFLPVRPALAKENFWQKISRIFQTKDQILDPCPISGCLAFKPNASGSTRNPVSVNLFGELIADLYPPPPPALPSPPSGPEKMTVALLGDSMIDTLGEDLPNLKTALKSYYPNTDWQLYNFGVGATDLEYGLQRLTNSFEYLGKKYPAVLSVNPDILIVESFAYNNFGDSPEGLERQRQLLTELLATVKKESPKTKVIFASSISPNASVYGDGIGGINWTGEEKAQYSGTVKKYLKNLVDFATSQNIPLANAYGESLDENGEGKLVYINPDDHLHYSYAGKVLFSQKIANAVIKILE